MDDVDILDIISMFIDEAIEGLPNFYRKDFIPYDNQPRYGVDVWVTDKVGWKGHSQSVLLTVRPRANNKVAVTSVGVLKTLNLSNPNFEGEFKKLLDRAIGYGKRCLAQ